MEHGSGEMSDLDTALP
uniref:Uncharacterized protein n=1 Tax=Arundo donax TaxID=35708 RepID=A0A0A8Z7A4_ARUDO